MAGQRSVYLLENAHKYKGRDPNQIVCRSSWERALCKWLDHNRSVTGWSSESVMVRYMSPVDGRPHRYYIDFAVELKTGKRFLVEVKPYAQTQPPVLPASGRKTKSYNEAVKTFWINQAKWAAAKKYADANGVSFVIWTERELKRMGIQINA